MTDIASRATAAARRVVDHLSKDIESKAALLADLQEARDRWSQLAVKAPRSAAKAGPTRAAKPRPVRSSSPAVDWDRVLKSLPPRFTMELIKKRTPTLAKYPRARIAGIARWVRGGEVTALGGGKYTKKRKAK